MEEGKKPLSLLSISLNLIQSHSIIKKIFFIQFDTMDLRAWIRSSFVNPEDHQAFYGNTCLTSSLADEHEKKSQYDPDPETIEEDQVEYEYLEDQNLDEDDHESAEDEEILAPNFEDDELNVPEDMINEIVEAEADVDDDDDGGGDGQIGSKLNSTLDLNHQNSKKEKRKKKEKNEKLVKPVKPARVRTKKSATVKSPPSKSKRKSSSSLHLNGAPKKKKISTSATETANVLAMMEHKSRSSSRIAKKNNKKI